MLDDYILKERTFCDRPDLIIQGTLKSDTKKNYLPSLDDAVDKYRFMLLLGEPGVGKTVELRKLKKTDKNQLRPHFVSLQKWSVEKDIITFLKKETGENNIDNIDNLLLLLDGLDELPFNVQKRQSNRDAKNIDYRFEFLSKLSEIKFNYTVKIVISCRRRDYEELREKTELKFDGAVILERLNNDEIQKYFKYLKDFIKAKLNSNFDSGLFWVFLNTKSDLLELIRTPFLLYILASTLFLHYKENADQDKNLVWDKITAAGEIEELLSNFIKQNYAREKKNKHNNLFTQPNDEKELEEKLGEIAVMIMSDRVPDDNLILDSHLEKAVGKESIQSFTKLATDLYLLSMEQSNTDNSDKRNYKFRHLILRDYFAFDYADNFFNRENNRTKKLDKESIVKAIGKINTPTLQSQSLKLLTDLRLLKDENPDVRYEVMKSLKGVKSVAYFKGYKSFFPQEWLYSKTLKGFDVSLTKKYFDSEGVPITDRQVQDIHECSGGNIFVIEQIAFMIGAGATLTEVLNDKRVPKRIKCKTPNEELLATVVERLLYYVKKEDKWAIYLLAIVRCRDDDFLKSMLDFGSRESLDGKLQELHSSYPFVEINKRRLDGIHQRFTKKYLLSLKKAKELEEYESEAQKIAKKINFLAVNYFSENWKNLTKNLTTVEQRLNDKKVCEVVVNLFYHKFWVNYINNKIEGIKRLWNEMIPYLVEGWQYNNGFALELLEVADEFMAEEVIVGADDDYKLLELLKAVLKKEKPKDKLSLLEKLVTKIDETQDKAEWVAIVLFKYSYSLYRNEYSKNIYKENVEGEILKRYKQALLCIPKKATDFKERFKSLVDSKLLLEEEKSQTEISQIIKKPTLPKTGSQSQLEGFEAQLIGEWFCEESDKLSHRYWFSSDNICYYERIEKNEGLDIITGWKILEENLQRVQKYEGTWALDRQKKLIVSLTMKNIKLGSDTISDLFSIFMINTFEEVQKLMLLNRPLEDSYNVQFIDDVTYILSNQNRHLRKINKPFRDCL